MKELKAKPKVTQAMTRDGLTLENQATGEVENISSREAEQDYTPETGGTAEKLLERADDAHDRHKAKKSAKQAAATAAEGDAALHRPSSRLQLTEEERADPDLQPYIRKADQKADKLDAARDAIPKKRVVVKETVYDEATGKAKSALRFEQQDKGPPKLKPNPAGRPVSEALLFAHGKIHEVEHENVGVEGGHKGEELAERQAGRAIRSSIRHHKLKPYRAAEKAERQALAANAEYFYQKSLRDNPEIAQAATNPVSRFWQKQQIKRQYAKAARTAGQTAGTAAQGAAKTAASSTKAAKAAAEESKRAASFVARHWKGSLAVLVLGLLLLMVLTGLQSCTAMFGSAGSGIAASSYFSEDSDMLAAEDAYAALEAELQAYLDNYEATHDYDEYHFNLDSIEHDPYVLISILSALHDGQFTIGEVRSDLQMLFDKQYILTETVVVETRYRTATDADGSTHDFLSECKLRSSDSNYYGTGSAFHLEKTKRSNGFDFYLKGKGYRVEVSQYPQGGSMSSPYDKRTYDVGTKCKVDITGDSISYTNTDTASLPLEFSMAYDEGNYNFSPLNAAKVTFDVAPNQTITITKKDTGFALTTNMETVVTINPEYNDDAINAFEGSEHDFVQYVTAYYLRFVMESNAMVNYNMEKKCSELSFDFNNDGVYDESPIAGDADCNGVPYEINDIYWTMQQIAESGAYGAGSTYFPTTAGDIDGNGKVDTNDLFDITYECALRGAGLKK